MMRPQQASFSLGWEDLTPSFFPLRTCLRKSLFYCCTECSWKRGALAPGPEDRISSQGGVCLPWRGPLQPWGPLLSFSRKHQPTQAPEGLDFTHRFLKASSSSTVRVTSPLAPISPCSAVMSCDIQFSWPAGEKGTHQLTGQVLLSGAESHCV